VVNVQTRPVVYNCPVAITPFFFFFFLFFRLRIRLQMMLVGFLFKSDVVMKMNILKS